MSSTVQIHSPGVSLRLGRFLGTRFRGFKGLDALLRALHHPDRRQHSWFETVVVPFSGGPKFHLSSRWFTEWTVWFYGTQDLEITQWLGSHIRPDWVAFDIGMNFGFFTCILAQRCAAVHGFEPVAWLAQRAKANVDLNQFHNVSIVELALSDQTGDASLNSPADQDANWGTSSLIRPLGATGSRSDVSLDTLDNYVERHKLARLDFIKLDVEGAEHLVLKGGAKTLRKHQPAIIFERNPESCEPAVALLRSIGYQFSDLHERTSTPDTAPGTSDILALPHSA